MNVARIVVLIVALVAGGAAAYLAMNLINQEPDPAVVTATATVESEEVLVASRDILIGSTIEANALSWRSWPTSGLTESYIRRSQQPDAIATITGSLARDSIYSGEPIAISKLVSSDGGLLSALLPSGMRAVATPTSAETGAGGFILPNDRVDVIMTRQVQDTATGDTQFITETVLQNVRVLAIDQQIQEIDGEPVVIGSTATLELTPQQAEIITVAQQMGDRLALSLRSLADAADPTTPEDDAVHLLTGGGTSGGITVVRNGVAQQVSAAE